MYWTPDLLKIPCSGFGLDWGDWWRDWWGDWFRLVRDWTGGGGAVGPSGFVVRMTGFALRMTPLCVEVAGG